MVDFNKLKVSRIQNAFELKQVAQFPTRGRNILDLILTDLDKFYDSPRKLPPFGLSDLDPVFVPPLARSQVPNPTYRTKSRSRDLIETHKTFSPDAVLGRSER